MNRSIVKKCKMTAILALFSLLFAGIVQAEHPAQAALGSLKKGTVAVMPFFSGDGAGLVNIDSRPPLICPINEICLDPGEENRSGEQALAESLAAILHKRLGPSLVAGKEVEQEFLTMPIDQQSDTLLSVALKMADRLKVDYVVVGIVWDFQERSGSERAVAEPASVSFSVFLVDVSAGKRVWLESFSRKQESLSSNIFKAKEFFEQGARWLTAKELGAYGMKQVLVSFPL